MIPPVSPLPILMGRAGWGGEWEKSCHSEVGAGRTSEDKASLGPLASLEVDQLSLPQPKALLSCREPEAVESDFHPWEIGWEGALSPALPVLLETSLVKQDWV